MLAWYFGYKKQVVLFTCSLSPSLFSPVYPYKFQLLAEHFSYTWDWHMLASPEVSMWSQSLYLCAEAFNRSHVLLSSFSLFSSVRQLLRLNLQQCAEMHDLYISLNICVPICYEVICSYLLWVKILEILLEDFFLLLLLFIMKYSISGIFRYTVLENTQSLETYVLRGQLKNKITGIQIMSCLL